MSGDLRARCAQSSGTLVNQPARTKDDHAQTLARCHWQPRRGHRGRTCCRTGTECCDTRKERNDADNTSRLAAVPQGTVRILHRRGPRRPAVPGACSGTREWWPRHFRAWRPQRLAYASARPDLDHYVGPRLGSTRRRADRGSPGRRCGLVSPRPKTLARSDADDRDDPYRHSGIAKRQDRRLAGKGQRRAISRMSRRRPAGSDMNARQLLILGAAMLTLSLCGPALAQETRGPYVRLAELEIDPAQLESFKAAIKEGIEAAVRAEPGVLALHAVSEK